MKKQNEVDILAFWVLSLNLGQTFAVFYIILYGKLYLDAYQILSSIFKGLLCLTFKIAFVCLSI